MTQVMQFGRIDANAYTLDFQYPLTAIQVHDHETFLFKSVIFSILICGYFCLILSKKD